MSQRIAKYEVVEKIAEGGFGIVYKARDPFIKRLVAIKTCSVADEEMARRFYREAEIAGRFDHPNVTIVHDFGVEDQTAYLVQEYLSGEDLLQKIRRRDPIPLKQKVDWLLQVANGLAYAHAQQVIHRDIKPANLRVLETGQVKILDFGIAKLANATTQLTQKGMAVGTLGYLSPEQLRDQELDTRTDIFSYGVVAYELIAYARPFQGKQLSALMDEILNHTPPPLAQHVPEVPASLERVVAQCLAKDRERRYQSFFEVAADLEEVRRELTASRPVPVAAAATTAAVSGEGGAAPRAQGEPGPITRPIPLTPAAPKSGPSELPAPPPSSPPVAPPPVPSPAPWSPTPASGPAAITPSPAAAGAANVATTIPSWRESPSLPPLPPPPPPPGAITTSGRTTPFPRSPPSPPPHRVDPPSSDLTPPAPSAPTVVMRPDSAHAHEPPAVSAAFNEEPPELLPPLPPLAPPSTAPPPPVAPPPVTAEPAQRWAPRPTPTGSRRIPWAWIVVGAIGLLALAIFVAARIFLGQPKPTVAPTPVATAAAQPSVPVAPTSATLVILGTPWGELQSLKDAQGRELPLPERRETPLLIGNLPAGHYVATLRHPGAPAPVTCEVDAVVGQAATCRAALLPLEPLQYFKEAGWWR